MVHNKNYFTDEYTDVGESYSYSVKPYRIVNNKKIYGKMSKPSKEIKAIPKKVSEVKAHFLGFDKVRITWKANKEVSGYYIYRRKNKGKWENICKINDSDQSSYTDSFSDTDRKNEYQYKIIPYEIVEDKEYKGTINVDSVKAYSHTGIDVSYHNGTISWSDVKKEGIDFAFIRAGYGLPKSKRGGVVDYQFARNVKNARKNGIHVGVYFYSCARNVKQSKKEARFLVSILRKYGEFDYPVAYDFESSYRRGYKHKKQNTKMIKAFCKIIEEAGYDAMVYSDYDMLYRYTKYKEISKYDIWMAHWTYNPENYPDELKNVKIWQYSDRGRIKGIPEDVDRNVRFIN